MNSIRLIRVIASVGSWKHNFVQNRCTRIKRQLQKVPVSSPPWPSLQAQKRPQTLRSMKHRLLTTIILPTPRHIFRLDISILSFLTFSILKVCDILEHHFEVSELELISHRSSWYFLIVVISSPEVKSQRSWHTKKTYPPVSFQLCSFLNSHKLSLTDLTLRLSTNSFYWDCIAESNYCFDVLCWLFYRVR